MDKQTTIKASEITSAYCQAMGCFPDEICGAQPEELRSELIAMGFDVEEIPALSDALGEAAAWESTLLIGGAMRYIMDPHESSYRLFGFTREVPDCLWTVAA